MGEKFFLVPARPGYNLIVFGFQKGERGGDTILIKQQTGRIRKTGERAEDFTSVESLHCVYNSSARPPVYVKRP